jgi:hypothetical protein
MTDVPLPLAATVKRDIGSPMSRHHVMLMARRRGRAAIPMSVTVKHVCTHTQSRFSFHDKNMKKNTNLVKVTETKRKIDARATRLASTSGDARRATPTGLV